MTKAEESRLDPAVVTALYLDHSEELKRFLVGVLRDSQLANDVLQATFTKAVEVGHTTHQGSRKGWLFRVAFNEAMAVRRRQAVDGRAVERLARSRSTPTGRADDPVVHFETVENVREAVAKLPEPQRQVLRMRIYEDKTFAEIARELDIPLGTALGRMRIALAKLREALKDDE